MKNKLKFTESPKQTKANDPIKKTGLNPDNRTIKTTETIKTSNNNKD